MCTLRRIVAALPFWFAIAGSAQTTLRVFTSPDGDFRFKYSPLLVDCTKLVPTKPTSSGVPKVFVGNPPALSVPDSCMSQATMCSNDPASTAKPIACFGYPKDEFKKKPTFTAATFFVTQIDEATTEKTCLQGSQYWDAASVEAAKITEVNGINFKVFEISDAWAGGGVSGSVYRTFHNNKCYEMGIQTAGTNPGAYDPETIEEFTKEDNDKVQGRLKEPLLSFTFTK